jgi:hypothetical protein
MAPKTLPDAADRRPARIDPRIADRARGARRSRLGLGRDPAPPPERVERGGPVAHRVHAALIRMVRSGPEAAAAAWDVVIDSCSVRAKHGGELSGPNPTDRAKRGAKFCPREFPSSC